MDSIQKSLKNGICSVLIFVIFFLNTEHSFYTAGQLLLLFLRYLKYMCFICILHIYIGMYAFKCCSTDINFHCNLPGHCSHLIYYSDALEEHDRELDRLAFSAAAWCSLNSFEKTRKEAYEKTSNSLKLNSLWQPDLQKWLQLLKGKVDTFPDYLWSLQLCCHCSWKAPVVPLVVLLSIQCLAMDGVFPKRCCHFSLFLVKLSVFTNLTARFFFF